MDFMQNGFRRDKEDTDACKGADGDKHLRQIYPVAGYGIIQPVLNGIPQHRPQHDKQCGAVQKNDCQIGKAQEP